MWRIKSIFLQVVEAPDDVADGAALCAFQYFENIRNFLVAVEELGLPSFEASDMEKVEKSEVLKEDTELSITDLLYFIYVSGREVYKDSELHTCT